MEDSNDLVTLNVRGTIFTTTMAILLKVEGKRVPGEFAFGKNENGAYMIDRYIQYCRKCNCLRLTSVNHYFFRDPKTFKVCLSYRTGNGKVDPSDLYDARLRVNSYGQYVPRSEMAPSTPSLTSEIPPVGADDVRVNVRGTIFSATMATLRSHPETKIGMMFQEGELASARRDRAGAYRIDRYTKY